ncbi:MAG: hypothetical protein IJZ02_04800, partial [Clostridia bacterium]|nr:hypothetical protein [Clostridia bacterium]
GRKAYVYGKRVSLGTLDAAVEDLKKLDELMRRRYDYAITMHRPPHYVDRMQDGFTAYDVCDVMGYQYLAASFDGAGWLPAAASDPETALAAEVEAMITPLRRRLEADPNAFCGQIIFQKDGYNMAKRTPVAFGLREQLALLQSYGYRVVTVAELMAESPFADVGRDDPDFDRFCALTQKRAVVYADNRLRPEAPMTWGELAMLLTPKEEAIIRRHSMVRRRGKAVHPYAGAMEWGRENGLIPKGVRPDAPLTELPAGKFDAVPDFTRRSVYRAYGEI